MLNGADILKTLIELLEEQEQIKITYQIVEDAGNGKNDITESATA